MTEPTGACCPAPSIEQLQAAFLRILPAIQTHASIYFRGLKCPGKRDDAVAETVAVAWKWHLRLAGQGKDATQFPGALATLAARHVRCGRRLVGQEKSKDCLSPLAQSRHGFCVEALPHSTCRGRESLYGDPRGQEQMDAFEERLHDNTQTPVFDQVVFRCDFKDWLTGLPQHSRRIVAELMAGEGTGDVAGKFGISPARVSQMRRELMLDWRRFVGEVC
jgi:hypothetical protein